MDNLEMQEFWERISVGKTPGTIPVSDLYWDMLNTSDPILEVGCAWGRIVFECIKRNVKVVGIDVNQSEIASLKKELIEQNIPRNMASVFEGNILSTVFNNNQFQGAVMLGVLSAMSKEERETCLKETHRILNPGGLIHVGEFELNMKEPEFVKRYEKDFRVTGEYGTLSVKNSNGKELYRSHNFTIEEITDLITKNGFKVERLIKDTFTSYHGNRKPGMTVIARKII